MPRGPLYGGRGASEVGRAGGGADAGGGEVAQEGVECGEGRVAAVAAVAAVEPRQERREHRERVHGGL